MKEPIVLIGFIAAGVIKEQDFITKGLLDRGEISQVEQAF